MHPASIFLFIQSQAGAQCDARLWLAALKQTIAQVKQKAGITSDEIGTIAFACIDASVVPVNADMEPLDDCMIWMDSRTGVQAERLQQKISEERAVEISGSPITPFQDATKLMWWKEERPEIYKSARYFCEVTSFFVGYLTGDTGKWLLRRGVYPAL